MSSHSATVGNFSYEGPNEGRFTPESGKPLEIVVHNRSGQVRVRGSDRPDITLRVDDADWDDDIESMAQFSNNRLEVRVDGGWGDLGRHAGKLFRRLDRQVRRAVEKSSWQIDFDDFNQNELRRSHFHGGDHDIEIEVPNKGFELRIEAHSVSGDVEVLNVGGIIDVATASGDTSLTGVTGDITAQTASADLRLDDVSGTLRIRTASGDVSVDQATLEQYAVTTASGEVNISATLIGGGPYLINTASGDVHLELKATDQILARGLVLPYRTVSGDGHVEGPLRQVKRRLWRAGAETDTAVELPVNTVSGDLHVQLVAVRGGAKSTAEDLTIPIPPRQERREPQAPADDDDPFGVADLTDQIMASVMPAVDDAVQAADEASRAADELAPQADALSRLTDEMAASFARGANVPTPPTPPTPPVPAAPATPATPPAPPVPPASFAEAEEPAAKQDDRLSILAALERGEIDVDEAMRRLDEGSAS